MPLEKLFFSLGPPKEAFFPFGKGKKMLKGGGPVQICFLILAIFFQHEKKILNFLDFVIIKMAKSKLDHLGFYCKPSGFLIGQSEESEGHPVHVHNDQENKL